MYRNPRTAPSPTRARQQLSQLERTAQYWIEQYQALRTTASIPALEGALTAARCSAHVQEWQWQQKNRVGQHSVQTEITC